MSPRHWLPSLALLLSGCLFPEQPPPALEVELHDQPVTCDATTGVCRAQDGRVAAGELHRVRVRLTELPPSAAYPRGGLVIAARLQRPGGVLGQLTIQIPVVRGTTPPGAPKVDYTEWRGSDTLFTAGRAAGRVELSWDTGCPCQTGRLELLLTDPGTDGQLDTADDQVRRFTRARLRRGDRPFCHRRAVLPIRNDLLVVGTRPCPARRGSSGGGYACGWGGGAGGWIGGWNDDGWYDDSWDGDWDDPTYEDDWCDCGWTDDGEWYEEGGWYDDGWCEVWGGSGGSGSSSGGGRDDDDWWDDGGSDWSDDWGDDWWDDGGSDWGDDGSDDWGDDGGWDDGGDDDWGDDDWWDD